jgi:hypothetical protein
MGRLVDQDVHVSATPLRHLKTLLTIVQAAFIEFRAKGVFSIPQLQYLYHTVMLMTPLV